ncbi:MAG: DbpA RNA binding domain-containing protein, partial [Luteimonas sp.]
IVGAIANEADLESKFIGRIDIRDDSSLVDLPEGMPKELLEHLKKVRVGGQPIRIRRAEDADMTAAPPRAKRPFGAKPPGHKPGGFKPGGPRKGPPPRRDPR